MPVKLLCLVVYTVAVSQGPVISLYKPLLPCKGFNILYEILYIALSSPSISSASSIGDVSHMYLGTRIVAVLYLSSRFELPSDRYLSFRTGITLVFACTFCSL